LKKWDHTPPSSLATLRIEIGETVRLGPGKVQLLELIAKHGSISAASRMMGMGYRYSWMLIDTLNRAFREPVVVAQPGGRPDQRAAITPFGHEVIRRYRGMEAKARDVLAGDLAVLEAALREEVAVPTMLDPRIKP